MGKVDRGGEQSLPLRVLKKVEWCGRSVQIRAPICPVCKGFKVQGHKDGCELVEAMGILEKPNG
jgi:hypothetical protein